MILSSIYLLVLVHEKHLVPIKNPLLNFKSGLPWVAKDPDCFMATLLPSFAKAREGQWLCVPGLLLVCLFHELEGHIIGEILLQCEDIAK